MSRVSGNQLLNGSVTFANSSLAGSTQTLDHAIPAHSGEDAYHVYAIKNPSLVTALTVSVQIIEVFASVDTPCNLTELNVPAGEAKAFLVQGSCVGKGIRLTFSNDTLLGGSDGFTAYVKVRSL